MLAPVQTTPFITGILGTPSGEDTNGDSVFSDRPAFAEDLARPSVRVTRFGAFDLTPRAGQGLIPRNYGEGPGYFVVNLNVTRTFAVGGAAPAARAQGTGEARGDAGEGRFRLTVGVRVLNLFNRVNLDAPVGNLGSPLFGRSTATAGVSGAISGGHPAAGNRRLDTLLRFEF